MYRLYDNLSSGNGWKCRWMLTQLGLPFERVEIDIDKGESRTKEFLAINPNGRIPVLQIGPGDYLAESNAILWFLAEGTRFLPEGRRERAELLKWLFWEQYSHEPYVATPRFIVRHLPDDSPRRRELPERLEKGRAALAVMEQHLAKQAFFVDGRYGLADIALYAYTHVAPDGGLDLAPFPAVRRWLERVAAQPGHVTLLA